MNVLTALFLGGLVVAALVDAAVAVYAWCRRPAAGSLSLCALTVANGWWALGYLFELLAVDLPTKLLWARLEWLGVLAGPVAWLCFALTYTGRDRYVTPGTVAVASVVPALAYVAVWTNPLHGLMWTAPAVAPLGVLTVLDLDWGVGYWVALGYSYLLMALGAAVLVRTALALPRLYRVQASVLVVGAAMPLLGNVVSAWLAVRGAALDITPIAFVGAGIACAASLAYLDLLDVRPVPASVAREHVVEHMHDAVIITDVRGCVTDVNEAATGLFGASVTALRGTPVTTLLPHRPDGSGATTVELPVDGSPRFFDLNASDLEDSHGRLIGTVLVLRDVTERRLHLQRLEVLNRVLRHNLRNEMNVVAGYADMIASAAPSDRADLVRYAEAISRSASDLTDIAENAREVETLTDPTTDQHVVSARRVIVDAVSAVRDAYPDAEVVAETLPDPCVAVPWSLESVVANLVENAAEHNPKPTPHVSVAAEADDDWVTVRVRDDGPGIPATERLTFEASRETPLVHGNGLGLWLVRWGTQAAGGTVSFHDLDPGTEVVVRVPVVDGDPADGGE
ncbi:histidine kinase N-terminal 7TM domain-containing protein [Halarchaeum sp. P4]|uniref:histidine kinase N-terminal 7TM domain-containing protein n=1 Tax=Halarchaeum sp. P4 TaxID=3421639 RepID=UPI003EBA7FF8